jgi:hypothetical protein
MCRGIYTDARNAENGHVIVTIILAIASYVENAWVNRVGNSGKAVLERIIKTSRDEGDLVLDCFCGSGITETTGLLLAYWFKTDHRLPNGRTFRYHYAQQEAVETLVYHYEVAAVRRQTALLERFAPNLPGLRLLQYDEFTRYCVKMATASGKTKVMALSVAWQYLNAVAEGRDDYARTFLVLAPNVIVFERLATDFGNGRIFRADPVIPPELRIFWDLDCYQRGDAERASSSGALYLTNVQQLYERPAAAAADEPAALAAVLGPRPPAKPLDVADFDDRIAARGAPALVLNDEAHHTHERERVEQSRPPPPRRAARRPRRPIRLLGHAALQQGRAVHLDRLRLPAQAGHPRQPGQAPAQGPRRRHPRAPLRPCQREVPGLPHSRRRALA